MARLPPDPSAMSAAGPSHRGGSGILWRMIVSALLVATMSASLARLPQQAVAATGLTEQAESYLEATLGRAAALFLAGRVLNGIISVIQGSQVSIGVGVGGQIAVGEALDPLNDLVEQFSTVMLACVISLGLQKLFFDIGLWLGLTLMLPIGAMILAVGLWLPGGRMRRFGLRVVVLALTLALAIPVISLVSGAVTQRFAGAVAERAEAEVRALAQQVEPTQQAVAPADRGLIERLLGRVDIPLLSLDQMAKAYETLVHSNVSSLIELIKIFVLQTILLPLATLWLALWLARAAVR